MPILLFGSRSRRSAGSPTSRRAGKLAAFGLTEPEAGSDAGATRTTRRAARRRVGHQRREDLHHERRHGDHRVRHDHRAHRRRRDLEHRRPERDAGLRRLRRRSTRWAGAPPTRASSPSEDCAVPEEHCSARAAQGFQKFLKILDGGRIAIAAMGVGLAQGAYDLALRVRARSGSSSAGRSRRSRRSRSSSPTWPSRSRRRGLVYKAAWLKEQGRPFAREAAMAKLYSGELSTAARTRRPDPRRLRLHGRVRRSRGSTATRRSSRSARARARSSEW